MPDLNTANRAAVVTTEGVEMKLPKPARRIIALSLLTGLYASVVAADVTPGTATYPRLCTVAGVSPDSHAVCRDLRAAGRVWTVVYNGGERPQGYLSESGNIEPLPAGVPELVRPIHPRGVAREARHVGTGACAMGDNRHVPCSMYNEELARHRTTYHVMVYFHPSGAGVARLERMPIGANLDALVAELAFQIGRAQAGSGCCVQRAGEYIRYAQRLFPRAAVYRAPLPGKEQARTERPGPDVPRASNP